MPIAKALVPAMTKTKSLGKRKRIRRQTAKKKRTTILPPTEATPKKRPREMMKRDLIQGRTGTVSQGFPALLRATLPCCQRRRNQSLNRRSLRRLARVGTECSGLPTLVGRARRRLASSCNNRRAVKARLQWERL